MENICLILAGGKGTRITPAIGNIPKALAPVGKSTFLELQASMLNANGISRIIVSIGHLSSYFEPIIKKLKSSGISIETIVEPYPLGTGGAILEFAKKCDTPFNVINGDTYFHGSIEKFVHTKFPTNATAVIGINYVSDTNRFGIVETNNSGIVVKFNEQKRGIAGRINAGIYKFHPSISKIFENVESASLEADIFPVLIPNQQLHTIEVASPFIDIGVPEDYHNFLENYSA